MEYTQVDLLKIDTNHGIIFEKGRAKQPHSKTPSLLEQLVMRLLEERSEPGKPAVFRICVRSLIF